MNRAFFIAVISLFLLLYFAVAEEYMELYSEEFPSGKGLVTKSAFEWSEKGRGFELNESYELALMCYNKSNELDPSYIGAWYSKGFILNKMGRYEEALKAFDKTTEINPLFEPSWNMKGEILYDLNRYNEALEALNISLELDSDDLGNWLTKGVILGKMGMHQEAIKCFDTAIVKHSMDSFEMRYARDAWHNKGIAYKALGNESEADAAFAKAKELGYDE
jgi:tetratricopeptide (TPR) repeat protein